MVYRIASNPPISFRDSFVVGRPQEYLLVEVDLQKNHPGKET